MKEKNYTLYCTKGIAALIILCMHSLYPRVYVPIINDLTKVGVMIFFLTSGFYWRKDRTFRSIIKLLKIFGISLAVYLLTDCLLECLMGSPKSSIVEWATNIFSMSNIINCIVFNIPFISSATPLWFVIALIDCYIFMYFVAEKRNILFFSLLFPLVSYILQMALKFGVFDLNGSILCNPELYRNWIFVGIPFFSFGILLNRFYTTVSNQLSINKWFWMPLIVGGGLMFIEDLYFPLWVEYSLGKMVFAVSFFAVIVLTKLRTVSNYPAFFVWLGCEASLYIYVIHPLYVLLIQKVFSKLGIYNNPWIPWFTVVLVLTLSLATSKIFLCAKDNYFKWKKNIVGNIKS